MTDLATINVSNASLPQTYQAAKNALAECASIDECQDWADKAAALASYARQAKDDQLERMSQRIRARAIRRAGELLKQLDGTGNNQHTDATDSKLTQREAAKAAGMSERQQVTAVRVASVPQDVFDTVIDDERPATVTQLAEMGKKAAPKPLIDLKGRDPKAFNRCMHFIGMLDNHLRDFGNFDMEFVFASLDGGEKSKVRELVSKLDAIHDQIVTRI